MRPLLISGARPNYMKVAPIVRAFRRAGVEPVLVNTGQHFDEAMSGVFMTDLGLPRPDVDLQIGSDTPTRQVARIMAALEPIFARVRPDMVVVVGDVSSTLAAALAADLADIPVAHVEAGLRSGDWAMPEERNRVLTDRLSSWLLTPSEDADENLRREGIVQDRICRVGNVMIDTLDWVLPRLPRASTLSACGVAPGRYGLVTMHRPANVDSPADLGRILEGLERVGRRLPLVFPVHPRTERRLAEFGCDLPRGVRRTAPLPYPKFVSLLADAAFVITDSGGIQEEATVLGVPCLTVRTTTERPVTLEFGHNELVAAAPDAIEAAVERALAAPDTLSGRPPLWDGRASDRIVQVLTGTFTAQHLRAA